MGCPAVHHSQSSFQPVRAASVCSVVTTKLQSSLLICIHLKFFVLMRALTDFMLCLVLCVFSSEAYATAVTPAARCLLVPITFLCSLDGLAGKHALHPLDAASFSALINFTLFPIPSLLFVFLAFLFHGQRTQSRVHIFSVPLVLQILL